MNLFNRLASLVLFAFCSRLLALQAAEPLDTWHVRNPFPTGNALKAISFGAGQFIAVGNAGTIVTSADGISWAVQQSAAGNDLNVVGYGNGLFVVFGTNGFVQTSPDATNWTAGNFPVRNVMRGISYGAGKYVAVGDYGMTVASSDGINWVANPIAPLSASFNLDSVCYGNGIFAAKSLGMLATSTDGVSWSTNSFSGYVDPIVFGKGQFVAAGFLDEGFRHWALVMSSTDCVTWTQRSETGRGYSALTLLSPSDANGSFLVLGQVQNLISPDGLTWAPASPGFFPNGGTGSYPVPAAYGNGKYVAAQDDGGIYTSDDGSNWVRRSFSSVSTMKGIAYGNGVSVVGGDACILRSTNGLPYSIPNTSLTNGYYSDVVFNAGVFTAVGDAGLVAQSTDGFSWAQRTSATLENLTRVAAGHGLLVAVAQNGRIQTSPDGRVWTGRNSGTDLPLYGVAYGNGSFVAVGYQGTVLTSADGFSWTAQFSGQISALSGVAHGHAGFVAVGQGGTIIRSLDGVVWTTQNSGSVKDLVSIVYGNGQYVAVGTGFNVSNGTRYYSSDPVLLSSSDGVNWIARQFPSFGAGWLGSSFANGRFSIVGPKGIILESDPVPPVPFSLSAQPGPLGMMLTIFSPPGPSCRIQANTDFNPATWSDVASFTNVSGLIQWTDSVNQTRRFYRAVSP